MKIDYYDNTYKVSGQVELSPKLYEVALDTGLVEQAVRIQLSNARSAISHTKNRGEVSGGGKKPWKQKGTGKARAGSNRSPIWRHGGITFGPRSDRNYELKMNKKEWRKALAMVLSDKAANQGLLVMNSFSLAEGKTKELSEWVANTQKAIAPQAKKFLVVLPSKDDNIERAVRNLKTVRVIHANSLNIVDLLDCDSVIMPKTSLEVIEKTYLKPSGK
jgi:large subunit ribosomal protein L4